MLAPDIILVTGDGCSFSRGGAISSGLLVKELPGDGTSDACLVRGTMKASSAGDISNAGLISPRAEPGSGDVGGNLKLPSDAFLVSLATGVPGEVPCFDVRLLGLGRVDTLLSVCARPSGGGDVLKNGEGCKEREPGCLVSTNAMGWEGGLTVRATRTSTTGRDNLETCTPSVSSHRALGRGHASRRGGAVDGIAVNRHYRQRPAVLVDGWESWKLSRTYLYLKS